MDWLDLLAVQGTLRSLFQHHSSKASILQHLLTDLKKVNASMKPMGALQPGIPSPTIIPQNWHIIIIDLQDCFFKIPLHPLD